MASTRYPRRFVDPNDVLDDFSRVDPYFRQLLERDISTVENMERWLLDGSELAACLGEVRTDRYVKMTCHTDDAELSERYLKFVEEVDPQCRLYWHKLKIGRASCRERV